MIHGGAQEFSVSGAGTSADPYIFEVFYELPAAQVTSGHLPTEDQIVTCYMSVVPESLSSISDLTDAETLTGFSQVVSTFVDESTPNGSSPDSQTSFAEKIFKPILVAFTAFGWLLT